MTPKPPPKSRTFLNRLFSRPTKLLKSLSIQGLKNSPNLSPKKTARLKKSATCPEEDPEMFQNPPHPHNSEFAAGPSNASCKIYSEEQQRARPDIILEEAAMTTTGNSLVLENLAATQTSPRDLVAEKKLNPGAILTVSLTEEHLLVSDNEAIDK